MFLDKSPILSSSEEILIDDTVSLKSMPMGCLKAIKLITKFSILISNSFIKKSFPETLSARS